MHSKIIGLVLTLTLSFGAQALGFKEISVNSFLNQPLDARIELISISTDEADGLRVSLASPEAFTKADITRPSLLAKLNFQTFVGDDQKVYIHVTTKDAIREPFLNFLIEVALDGNKVLREYTVLLDPPINDVNLAQASPASVPAKPVSPKEALPQPLSRKLTVDNQYGPVKPTDTLWDIANNLRPDTSVSVEQMMMAILRENPSAFMHENVNFLKRGAILKVPDKATITKLSVIEAQREFFRQSRAWQELKGVVSSSVQSDSGSGPEMNIGELKKAQTKEELVEETADESAKLSVVETGAEEEEKTSSDHESSVGDSDAVKENQLRDQVADSRRDLQAVLEINKELEKLQSAYELKIEALRKSLEERSRSIEILEQKLNLLKAGSNLALKEEQEKSTANAKKLEINSRIDLKVKAGQELAEKKPQPSAVTAKTSRDDWLAIAEEYWLYLAAAAFFVLLLLLFIMLQKRRTSVGFQDAYAFGSYVGDDSQLATQEHPLLGQAVTKKRKLKDAADSDGNFSSNQNTNVETTLSKVDIYLAYRKYGLAEELVKEAIHNHPDNMTLKAKLLEIYAFRKDKKRFIAAMEKVYQRMIASSPEIWVKVVELGRVIAPDHELIAGADVSDYDADSVMDNLTLGLDDLADLNPHKD